MVVTCGIWLINSENKILFVHPTYHPKDFYSIPKGLMDAGESEFETMKREMFEETLISWEDIESSVIEIVEMPLKVYKSKKKALKSFIVITDSDLYNLELRCDSMVEGHKYSPFPEVDEFIWKTIEEAERELDLHHSHEMCIEEIKNVLNSL